MFPVDFGNVYRLGPNCTPARGYFHVTQINTYESTLSVFHKPNQACATKRRHRLGECECSPSLIHCFKHWLGAFISLNLPHALALSLALAYFSRPPDSEPDESKVRKTTSQYAAKRSAVQLRELWRGLSLSVALRDLACNSFL